MSEFSINYEKGSIVANELDSCKNSISRIRSRLDCVVSGLDSSNASMSIMKSRISSLSDTCSKQQTKIEQLSVGLKGCIDTYRATEKDILGYNPNSTSIGSISNSGTVISGTISSAIVTQNGIVDVEGNAELIGGSYKKTIEAGIKYKDGELDEVSAELGIEAEGHLAKVEGEVNYGILNGKGEINVGQGTVKGSVKASLYEDGELAPGLGIVASVGIAGVNASVEGRAGSEENNVHVKAEGTIGKAEAEASAGVGMITYQDKDGKEHHDLGVQASAKAEAYAVEGTVTGGINIFGIKVDVDLTGKAGGAGVGADAYATTGKVGASLTGGLGVGAEVGISIDFSDFKWPKIKPLW